MLELCSHATPDETGGVLVGTYTSEHDCALVLEVSAAPADSQMGRSWFSCGTRGLSVWLRQLWHGKREYYLGEWHFHPYARVEPSPTDVDSVLSCVGGLLRWYRATTCKYTAMCVC